MGAVPDSMRDVSCLYTNHGSDSTNSSVQQLNAFGSIKIIKIFFIGANLDGYNLLYLRQIFLERICQKLVKLNSYDEHKKIKIIKIS